LVKDFKKDKGRKFSKKSKKNFLTLPGFENPAGFFLSFSFPIHSMLHFI